jgi:hypothetical protein
MNTCPIHSLFLCIWGHKIKSLKFQNCFTNWWNFTDNLAQVLERRAGSDSEVCCSFTDVKEFDSLEGRENCHQYYVEICSGVHLPRMLWSGLSNTSEGVEVAEA